ncbi:MULTISPECIES: beta-ketoacyl-ACP synthase III [unclassified Streptomyces]|uniref:beta-ketoacyl-ACP synthase III n=1 Tax=unclassified Streptomyces TaxID=2593676 RepID=UPI000AF0DC5D|nr:MULTISPECIES: beta-ketoacyl-ACP synthase III [unclassified Streptomyces]MCP3771231.1 ketoacyl-ACP synthase III [Streptomyces sp. MAR25Y5]
MSQDMRSGTDGVAPAVIAGIGAVTADRLVKNDELARRLDVSPDWIRVRTGIEQRYVLAPDEATSDLAHRAARRALAACGDPDIDFVILATCTPDHTFPSTAPSVASRLGLGPVTAFDLNAACSGFVYGLSAGAGLIASGAFRTGLVIGADAISTIIDHDDPVTAPIFGDGAGAVVLRAGTAGEPGRLLAQTTGSDGSLLDVLITPSGGSRQRAAGVAPDPADGYLRMEGRLVFRHAVRRMAEACRTVVERTGWSVDEVDLLVAHQANERILTATADELGLPPEKAFSNVDRVANTSAASIPLALVDALAAGVLRPGDKVVLAGFGGGATWGAVTLVWPDVPVGTGSEV